MTLRIVFVKIQGFRGIPQSLTLDLRPEHTPRANSLILLGDNGSGKSSIIDALEFALQGRITRQKDISDINNPYPISVANDSKCEIEIMLSDGTLVKRTISQRKDGTLKAYKIPNPNFAVSPFILRRADILQFWDAPESQRQLIFFDFLRDPKIESEMWSSSQVEIINKLSQKRIEAKKQRIALSKELADLLNLESDQVPVAPQEFNQFVRNRFYDGLSAKERQYIGWEWRDKHQIPDAVKQRIIAIRQCTENITNIDREIRSEKGKSYDVKKALLHVLSSASQTVTKSFLQISPTKRFVDKIEFIPSQSTDVSLSLNVHLSNGKVVTPQQIFSEANLDLLAMLVFLAVAKESANRGQAKVFVFDDVLQSVDSYIRLDVTEYILQEFSDWQLIFTLHERLWQEILKKILERNNHDYNECNIIRWDFDIGPVLTNIKRNADTSLKNALLEGNCSTICGQAGILLEQICDYFSYEEPFQLPRIKGDKYTLGYLWPKMKKHFEKTSIENSIDNVDKWLVLRNLIGAHYNQWAQDLSQQEAINFGESILELFDNIVCQKCNRWVKKKWGQKTTPPSKWACYCANIKISTI